MRRLPVRQSEWRYVSPSSSGVSQPEPSAMTTRAARGSSRVAPVRTGVHPDSAAGRPGNRARELEAAQPGRPRAVEQTAFGAPPPASSTRVLRPRPRRVRRRASGRNGRCPRRRRGDSSRGRRTASSARRTRRAPPRAPRRWRDARRIAPALPCPASWSARAGRSSSTFTRASRAGRARPVRRRPRPR